MKKILIALVMMISFAVSANAQSAVGINANLGMGNHYDNYGLGVKYQYSFTDHWRGEASFNYFFKKDGVSMYDANVVAHYLIPLGSSGFTLYPLLGVGLVGASAAGNSSSDLGFNYGLGIEYPLTESMKINCEFKGQTADGTREFVSLGLTFPF